jgi:hypothetical protein
VLDHAAPAQQKAARTTGARIGRFVFVAQWVAVILLPLSVSFGRMLFGAEPGWFSVLFLFYGAPLMALALLVGPVITVSARSIRSTRTAPLGYSIATLALWLLVLLVGAFIVDAGDSTGANAVAMVVFSIEPHTPAMDFISLLSSWFIGAAVLAWLTSLVLLIVALSRGRMAWTSRGDE